MSKPEKKLICPLLMIALTPGPDVALQKQATDCMKEKCAWYTRHEVPNTEGCAIKEISDALKTVSLRMSEAKPAQKAVWKAL